MAKGECKADREKFARMRLTFYALRCTELADRATDPQERAMYWKLALSWTSLATELENARAFLSRLSETKLDGSAVAD
jgi:hypothetical protein